MKGKLLTYALMAAGLPAVASTPVFSVHPTGNGESVLRSRTAPKASMRIKKDAAKHAPMRRSMWAKGSDIVYFDQFGELELKLEEDFSGLDNVGTEAEPDKYTKLDIPADDPDFTYPWWNFKPQYTKIPHWGIGNAYGAGGTIYWKLDYTTDQAHFNLPLLDLTEGDGVAVLEFRARKSADSTEDFILVEAGETHNMGPTWDNIDDAVTMSGLSTEWTTYRVMFRGCGPTTLLNVVGIFSKGPYAEPEENQTMWFDDVKVYQLKTYLGIPEVLPVSEYEGSSFVANWKGVEGADSYLLTVYSNNADTGKQEFLLEEEPVNGTSYKVTGAVSGETYYYEVKAVKGEQTSLPSFVERVYCLEKPVLNPITDTGDWSYKASWNAVPGADVYNYIAYNDREAEEDGLFVVTDEDFTGVVDADGNRTGWTKEDPEELSYDEYYISPIKQEGWYVKHGAPYTDYIAADAYWYSSGQGDAGLISPELDLSKDGGKFTVSADFAGDTRLHYLESGEEYLTTQVCAALFTWNDAKGDYDQVELLYPKNEVTEDWQNMTFEFTKGTDRSIIGLYAIGSLYNLYIDNLKVVQNYKKGDKLREPFLHKRYHGSREGEVNTEIEVTIPSHATGWDVYHKVQAFNRQVDTYGRSYDDRASDWSNIEFVKRTVSGIMEVTELGEGTVSVNGGILNILNPEGVAVTVCDMQGAVLLQGTAAEYSMPLADKGVYLVKVGTKAMKILN